MLVLGGEGLGGRYWTWVRLAISIVIAALIVVVPVDLATLAALAVVVAALTFAPIAATLLIVPVDLAPLTVATLAVAALTFTPTALAALNVERVYLATLAAALRASATAAAVAALAALAALTALTAAAALAAFAAPTTLAAAAAMAAAASISHALEPKDPDCHSPDDRSQLRYVTHHGNPSRSLQGPHS